MAHKDMAFDKSLIGASVYTQRCSCYWHEDSSYLSQEVNTATLMIHHQTWCSLMRDTKRFIRTKVHNMPKVYWRWKTSRTMVFGSVGRQR